jgi:hypothetical protein
MRGLDPRIHADATILIASRLIENLAAAWIAGSSPANDDDVDMFRSLCGGAVERMVWFVELQETAPRLVTLVPRRIVSR